VVKTALPWPEAKPSGIKGWLGRPFALELRSLIERRELRRSPLWAGADFPHGENRPIIVIPGFYAARNSATELVHVLKTNDWDVTEADVGRNSGPAYDSVDISERQLFELSERAGQPVTLIGHSRGGQFARILAVRHPALVEQVVALGAPLNVKYPPFFVVKLPAELLDRLWRKGLFGPVYPDREDAVDNDRYRCFPNSVDFVSIFSKTDGIVDWRFSADPAAAHIEIDSTHRAMWGSVEGIKAIATALRRCD